MNEYLKTIENKNHQNKLKEVLILVQTNFPMLEFNIKWNQPIFTFHKTFIIGFSVSKHHFSVAPEAHTIFVFANDITQSGYHFSNQLFRIRWEDDVNYSLLSTIIQYNINDKKDCHTFWRKESKEKKS